LASTTLNALIYILNLINGSDRDSTLKGCHIYSRGCQPPAIKKKKALVADRYYMQLAYTSAIRKKLEVKRKFHVVSKKSVAMGCFWPQKIYSDDVLRWYLLQSFWLEISRN